MLLALLVPAALAPIASAHGPSPHKPAANAAPPQATPPLDPAAVRTPTATGAGAVPTTGVQTLRRLVAESTVVAEGVVARTDSLDDDRLRVYHVPVERTLAGEAPGPEVAVVEMRSTTGRPGFLADGARAVLLLRPAPTLSYLAQHLPPGPHFVPVGGRDGVLGIGSDAERTAVERTLREVQRITALRDADAARDATRALAFAELATGHPRLAGDALVELRALDGVDRLTADELAALGRTLAAPDVPAPTRAGLVKLAGERPWPEALPVLRTAAADAPDVVQALLAARAALGASAGKSELESFLGASDPAVRAAAVRALAALPEPAVDQLGRFATDDRDVDVRVAAIDALGTTRRSDAVPVLSKTFAESTRSVKQASARALLAIGGPAASEALTGLALRGADPDTRKYAALLLVVSTGRDSAAVQRLMASNPSGEVRKVLEHGLEFRHSHKHD